MCRASGDCTIAIGWWQRSQQKRAEAGGAWFQDKAEIQPTPASCHPAVLPALRHLGPTPRNRVTRIWQ